METKTGTLKDRAVSLAKRILKCAIFLTILLLSLQRINEVLVPKFTDQSNPSWPMTSAYCQFYRMKPDTVDVLFLGSSVAENAFDPQELYDSCGIRSYNLGSEQQSAFLSYYWLKEALRSQSPEVVILDSHYLVSANEDSPIGTAEMFIRKCLDPMKLSPVKAEAVFSLCRLDSTQSAMSFFFPNIRYHTRWKSLQENDFLRNEYASSPMKGFGAVTGEGPAEWNAFAPYDMESEFELDEVTEVYLDRIIALCRQKGIELILLSLPGTTMDDGINNRLERYAREQGIDYYNLGLSVHYDAIGAKLPAESAIFHQNIYGAARTTRYIGQLLTSGYAVPSVKDAQYEASRPYHEHILQNAALVREKDPVRYMELLSCDDYVVLMTASFDASAVYGEETAKRMQALGLHTDLSQYVGGSYIAVLDPAAGAPLEMAGSDPLTYSSSFRGHRTFYTIHSGDYRVIDYDLIEIDGECASDGHLAGLHVVVFDLVTGKVIDTAVLTADGVVRQ